MALSPSDSFLRRVCAVDLTWAFAFLMAYTISTGSRVTVTPFLLIPQGMSAVWALFHLSNKATSRAFNILMDLFLGCALLGVLIPTCIQIQSRPYYRGVGIDNLVMVGTLGTAPAIVNCGIHLYFVLRESSANYILHLLFGNVFGSPTCPHCQREVIYSWRVGRSSGSTPSSGSVNKEGYVSVHQTEAFAEPSSSKTPPMEAYKDARPSTDDETAQLV